jgi:ADP-heptose:LPS heptosyltransferase
MGQFPLLDIALEWDGDKALLRKRNHVVDDLLGLVEAIATACGTNRSLLPSVPQLPDSKALPASALALFTRPVVAIHPGAGNVTKQWPAPYFAALANMLIERDEVNILLIGGADELEITKALLPEIQCSDRVVSVVGETRLADLPQILAACILYIGNDSGPKHIAAALGVPTIGIHSGVVDAIEWGPVGPHAIGLRRNMSCSPCYLANAEDCPRELACLRFLEPSSVYAAAQLLMTQRARPTTAQPPSEDVDQPNAMPQAEPTGATVASAPADSAPVDKRRRDTRRRKVSSPLQQSDKLSLSGEDLRYLQD